MTGGRARDPFSRRIDRQEWRGYVDARDYEGLELFLLRNLLGVRT